MWDCIVLGLGGVGSFALRSLVRNSSKSAAKVLGIELFQRGHSFGSSHGGSRIYRHAYFEHQGYVPLIQYSTEEFYKLQNSSGQTIVEECGTLIMEHIPSGDDNKGDPPPSLIASCMESALQHDIPVEKLTHADLLHRYGHLFNFDSKDSGDNNKMRGLLEFSSGFVRPEKAVRAALQDAEDKGANIWEQTKVLSVKEVVHDDTGTPHVELLVQRNADGIKENSVTTELIKTRNVIITAGAWASTFLPSWNSHLQVTRQIQGWIDVSTHPQKEKYYPANMPTWYVSSPQLKLDFYGIPVDPTLDQSNIKVAFHGRNDPVDPDESNMKSVSPKEWKELDEAAHTLLKPTTNFSDGTVQNNNPFQWKDAKACLYTMTPDEHFLVGKPLGHHCTYAVAGLSGHGFKMTPALGKIVADMALGGTKTNDWDIDFLAPSRFGI
mmetsp:Transcript_28090/g.39541  ORF Transcript_28090/g.39541 Transcript_28090/m.39541 type:complete len:437 (+) Transcript_28090:253-1563(+)